MVFSCRSVPLAPPPKALSLHERMAASVSTDMATMMLASIFLAVAPLLVVLCSRLRRRSGPKPVSHPGRLPIVKETPQTGFWQADADTLVDSKSARLLFRQLEHKLRREESERMYASKSHQRILQELQQENHTLRCEAATARKEAATARTEAARIHRTLNALLIAAKCDAARAPRAPASPQSTANDRNADWERAAEIATAKLEAIGCKMIEPRGTRRRTFPQYGAKKTQLEVMDIIQPKTQDGSLSNRSWSRTTSLVSSPVLSTASSSIVASPVHSRTTSPVAQRSLTFPSPPRNVHI